MNFEVKVLLMYWNSVILVGMLGIFLIIIRNQCIGEETQLWKDRWWHTAVVLEPLEDLPGLLQCPWGKRMYSARSVVPNLLAPWAG